MNILQKIFRRAANVFVNMNTIESGYNNQSENEIINSIADRIATQVSKLTPQVMRKDYNGTIIKNDKLSKLLTLRPCKECNTADWLYKIAYDSVKYGNGFAIIFYNKDFTDIEEIRPVTCRNFRIFEDVGTLFFKFTWAFDNNEYTVPYQSVIHLKDRAGKKRFIGSNAYDDLNTSIDMLNTTYEGIKNVVKNSAQLRGYMKFNNFIDEDDLKEKIQEFQNAYMKAENEGGIAGIGSEWEFKELTQQPRQIPITQVTFFRGNFYRYYGVSEKIITGEYSEDEWNSFFESKIEPIAMKLSLEFTYKLFTERERGFGNKIVFTANRLQYASAKTRMSIVKDLYDRGFITINQGLEVMDFPTIPDGDVRMISLNYVKIDEQSQYQVGSGKGSENNEK